MRQIGHPQAIRFGACKVAIDAICRSDIELGRDRRLDLLTALDTAQAHLSLTGSEFCPRRFEQRM